MSEISESTRHEKQEQLRREAEDREIANKIARRVLKSIKNPGQEISVTGRWNRGTITDRSIEIAREDLDGLGIHTHVESRQDDITNYEHAYNMGDLPLPYPILVVDELDDTKRQSRRRDKR